MDKFHQFMKERSLSSAACVMLVFKERKKLNEHIATLHERKKGFKCDVCDANFS